MTVLLNIIGAIVPFFLNFFTRKVLIATAAIAAFLAFTAAFIAAISAILASIQVSMPSEMNLAISWFMPSNANACLSAYFSALIARFIYDQKTKIIQYSLF